MRENFIYNSKNKIKVTNLGTNLIRNIQKLYEKNYKTVLKDKKISKFGKDSQKIPKKQKSNASRE